MKRTPLRRRTPLKTSEWKSSIYTQPLEPRKWSRKPKTAPRKRVKTKVKKLPKWKCSTADSAFSKWIRQRDGKCLKCGFTESLTCSHYWGRNHSGTRFDPDNCITLCMGPYSNHCHDEWEKRKNMEYKEFMITWLGIERYEGLERRARTFKKREEAIEECRLFLSTQLLNSMVE